MAIVTTLQIVHGDEASATIVDELAKDATLDNEALIALANLLRAAAGGMRDLRVTLKVEDGTGTQATQTVTCVQGSAANGVDVLTLGGVTFTASTAAAEGQFALGSSSTTMATNLAAAINAHSSLTGNASASSSTSIVTVTHDWAGSQSNFVGLTAASSGMTLGAATLTGASGTNSADVRTWNKGVA